MHLLLKNFFAVAILTLCCCYSGIASSDALDVYNSAFEAHKKGELAYAIQGYTQAIDDKELDNEALAYVHHYRGKALAQLEKFSQALEDFDTAVQLNSDINITYLDRANTLTFLGSNTLAIADYSKSIALFPKEREAYHNRGIALYNQLKYRQAITDYDQALALGNDAVTLHYRALAHLALGEYQTAVSDCDKAIILDGDNAGTLVTRADALIELGNNTRAILDYSKAIQLQGTRAGFYHKRSNAYVRLAKFELAVGDMDSALRIEPSNLSLSQNRNFILQLGAAVASLQENKPELLPAPQPVTEAPDKPVLTQSTPPAAATDTAATRPNTIDLQKHKEAGWQAYQNQQYADAVQHFKSVLAGNPNDVYRLITIYLASANLNQNPVNAVQEYLQGDLPYRWPATILKFYLGIKTEQQMLDRIAVLEAEKNNGRMAEINFYLGEYFLLNGDQQRALDYFRQSVASGVTTYNEYRIAKLRLAQLDKQ